MNFVTAHPRIVSVIAGFGIVVAFGSVGRLAVHELLTPTAVTVAAPIFQVDYIDKTPISESFRFVQHADAIPCCFCQGCGASDFAPGHEAISPGDAQNFAPGDLAKAPGDAQNFAPGQVFKKTLQ